MAGITGPVPARSDQRVRRNKPDIPIDTVEAIGTIEIPELGIDNPEPIVEDFYESMTQAAQKQYFEPTDWQYARLTMILLDQELKHARRYEKSASAVKIQALMSMLSNLLVTEGDRRRVRIEIERQKSSTDNVIDAKDAFTNWMNGSKA